MLSQRSTWQKRGASRTLIQSGEMPPLLSVRELSVEFATPRGPLRAADGVSLDVEEGETVGLVGESGCGKSVTALSILGLVPSPGRITGGQVVFEEEDLLTLPERRLQTIRGDRIAIVFQEPLSALNPTMRVGEQVAEGLRAHRGASVREARAAAAALLSRVGIPDVEECCRAYPHQLSGGMRQRVLIAGALICGPRLLIADEPTTALDVTLQAQVLELLAKTQRESGMGLLLVTHDLALVAESCRRVVVLYAGQVVEQGPVARCLTAPAHPYTAALLRAVRSLGGPGPLAEIPGALPDPCEPPPSGCRFADRCERAQPDCRAAVVGLDLRGEGWTARCIHPLEE
jgi:peptide/nickel transport system ATP-binding protein